LIGVWSGAVRDKAKRCSRWVVVVWLCGSTRRGCTSQVQWFLRGGTLGFWQHKQVCVRERGRVAALPGWWCSATVPQVLIATAFCSAGGA